MPGYENPQNLNRYAYALNNPVKYNDPSGHWIESAIDIAFIGYDIYQISQGGWSQENTLSLAADVGGLILPGVTGGGAAVRLALHADDAVDTLRVVNEAGNVLQAANEVENVVQEANQLDNAVDTLGAMDNDTVLRVVEEGKPRFQLKSGESGLSVFDESKISSGELLQDFRPGSSTVSREIKDIKAYGLDVVRTPGDPARLSQKACLAHCEIVPGPNMTRNQFKKALKELE